MPALKRKGIFMRKSTLLLSALIAGLLLNGCGESGTSSEDTSALLEGQLVDSYVENADYYCADGSFGTTDINGYFLCQTLPVEFKLGGLKLGEINTLSTDKKVFPQDLLGVARTNLNDTNVIAMARFLQSCDDDNNSENGLKIRAEVKTALQSEIDFNADDIESYVEITVDEVTAAEHLAESTDFANTLGETTLPQTVKTALSAVDSNLSQELKNTLAYMGNEERLAYDVYNKLYETSPLMQFTNIAKNGEYQHITAVQLLIQKYISSDADFTNVDLDPLEYKNTAIEDMTAGVYDIGDIQDLYNTLVAVGQESDQKALEVGCMVEVTDINDLDRDIILAQEENATDITAVFNFLRDGSYSHYWAFDKGLKNMGITDGCCVVGTEYCHPQYPQNENGNKYGQL